MHSPTKLTGGVHFLLWAGNFQATEHHSNENTEKDSRYSAREPKLIDDVTQVTAFREGRGGEDEMSAGTTRWRSGVVVRNLGGGTPMVCNTTAHYHTTPCRFFFEETRCKFCNTTQDTHPSLSLDKTFYNTTLLEHQHNQIKPWMVSALWGSGQHAVCFSTTHHRRHAPVSTAAGTAPSARG